MLIYKPINKMLLVNQILDSINVRTLVAKSSLMYTWYTHLAYCNNESQRACIRFGFESPRGHLNSTMYYTLSVIKWHSR